MRSIVIALAPRLGVLGALMVLGPNARPARAAAIAPALCVAGVRLVRPS